MIVYVWLFGTAVVFTAFGYYCGRKEQTQHIVQYTIDMLIDSGYLRTAIIDDEEVLLPWDGDQS